MKPYQKSAKEITLDFVKKVVELENLKVHYQVNILERHKVVFDYLDHFPGQFLFVHDFLNFKYVLCKSIRNVLGYSEDVLVGKSFGDCIQLLHPYDADHISIIHQKLFDYFFQEPVESRTKLRFDFNFRVRHKNGNYVHVLQQTVFPVLQNGKPLYDFSACTDITGIKKFDHLYLSVFKLNQQETYEEVYHYTVTTLSEREAQVEELINDGKSSKEIAAELDISVHTVNNHRKNILRKKKKEEKFEEVPKRKP